MQSLPFQDVAPSPVAFFRRCSRRRPSNPLFRVGDRKKVFAISMYSALQGLQRYISPPGMMFAERKGQRREPAADDVRFVSERIGWLPFAGPNCWGLNVSVALFMEIERASSQRLRNSTKSFGSADTAFSRVTPSKALTPVDLATRFRFASNRVWQLEDSNRWPSISATIVM